MLGITELDIASVTKAEVEELERRERRYRGRRLPLAVRGRAVILVDDVIATGASLEGLRFTRSEN